MSQLQEYLHYLRGFLHTDHEDFCSSQHSDHGQNHPEIMKPLAKC